MSCERCVLWVCMQGVNHPQMSREIVFVKKLPQAADSSGGSGRKHHLKDPVMTWNNVMLAVPGNHETFEMVVCRCKEWWPTTTIRGWSGVESRPVKTAKIHKEDAKILINGTNMFLQYTEVIRPDSDVIVLPFCAIQ